MHRLLRYLSERFPPFHVAMFSLGYSGIAIIASPIDVSFQKKLTFFVVIAILFGSFLLRQRVVDEFRDFDHDAKNYPNRPIHRKLISKNELIALGLAAFFVEIGVVIFFLSGLIYYLPIIFYSFLMAKDFFIKSWLDKHFTINFLIHEVFFFLLGCYVVLSINGGVFNLPFDFLKTIPLVTGPMSIELIRKFKIRYNQNGEVITDTYSAVWGKQNTVFLLSFLTFFSALSIYIIKDRTAILTIGFIFSFIILASQKNEKNIRILGILQYLLLAISGNIL